MNPPLPVFPTLLLEATSSRQKYETTLGKTVAPLAPGVACPRTCLLYTSSCV